MDRHLRPRLAMRRLDEIEPDDVARLVRELRDEAKSEATIQVVLGVLNRIYRYAARRLDWSGQNPVALLLPSERPKLAQAKRRAIFEAEQLEQTIAASHAPYRTLLTVMAMTGARISELFGLTWRDVELAAMDGAELQFRWQVDRRGERRPLKTDASARVVPISSGLASLLEQHYLRGRGKRPDAYVFATRSGRPLGQRNVARALRRAQRKATDASGRPTYPVLHSEELVPRGAVPSLHSFRHTLASRALAAGESVDELRSCSATRTPT